MCCITQCIETKTGEAVGNVFVQRSAENAFVKPWYESYKWQSCFNCWMTTPWETPTLTTKTIRDSIYKQKRSTQHLIMVLCPFHMGIFNRPLGLLNFCVITLWKLAAQLTGIAICAADTARSILSYQSFKNISFISKLSYMQNNLNFKFNIFSLKCIWHEIFY